VVRRVLAHNGPNRLLANTAVRTCSHLACNRWEIWPAAAQRQHGRI